MSGPFWGAGQRAALQAPGPPAGHPQYVPEATPLDPHSFPVTLFTHQNAAHDIVAALARV